MHISALVCANFITPCGIMVQQCHMTLHYGGGVRVGLIVELSTKNLVRHYSEHEA